MFSTLNIHSQSYIELSVDNDLYFLTDQYYSSGIIISYGKRNENGILNQIVPGFEP